MIMGEEKLVYSSVPEKKGFEDPPPLQNAPKGFGARHMQVLLLFISLTTGYTIRAQLSVAMVAMTNPNILDFNQACNRTTEVNETLAKNETSTDNETLVLGNSTKYNGSVGMELSKWNVYRTYDWHEATQEMILFSFFVGYTTMMMPIGIIAQKYGGKVPILVALAVNGIASILIPWVPIFSGWIGMCVVRLLQGGTQAAFYPSIHTILGKWAPVSERGRLSTYVYTGSQFGTILIFQVSGLFAGSPSLGWPAIFWLCGVLSLACLGLYSWLGSATPHDHPSISAEELMHIMGDGSADIKKRKTPWKHIVKSTAVCGLVASHAGSVIGYLMILTQTPTYMSKVLGVDIKHNGVYSSLPYIAMYLLTLVFGQVSDWLLARKIMSIANIRRTANTIGMVVSAIFLVAFGFVKSTSVAVTLLVLCIGFHSGVHVGFHINQIDLAPNFAGPIMALGNMVGNLTSLLVPVFVSNVIGDDVTNQQRWQILFIVIAAFQVLTNVLFVVFVKGEVQPWNFYGDESYDNDVDMYALKEKNKQLVQEMRSLNEKSSAEQTT